MPNRRLPVPKIKEMLRLRFGARLSERKIARSCNVSRTTVSEYLNRASEAGLTWPEAANLSEEELYERLFPPALPVAASRPLPDWAYVRKEAARPNVTLLLLWEEYRAEHPDGYSRTQFYAKYRAWCETLEPVMRITHKAGEKVFVDYSGRKVPITNPETGEVREAEVFVGTLGASSYTYAEATWTQSLPDWIGSHVRMFAFFGGVPRLIVPDNLKSGVTKACFYEPGINETYRKMAEHYGVAVLPARVREPKDKAKVESAVGVVQRRILARLRNRTFFSLGELNEAIAELLAEMNNRPFQKMAGSRRSLFEEMERDQLSPLPRTAYVYREWKKARAGVDYHVAVEKHYYSVPFTYIKRKLDVCLTAETVEIFASGERNASHRRSWRPGGYTTVLAHKACLEGFTARYLRLTRMLAEMEIANADGRYPKLIRELAKTDVLVLDDWGLAPVPDHVRPILLEILDDRHGNGSTIVTSQLPIERWHTAVGEATSADAILDRLVHNGHSIELKGDSMRKKLSTLKTTKANDN
jgi:transposase